MVLEPGTQFGTYEITGSLDAGGMGEVYQTTGTKLKRDVAIKVLAAEPLLGGSLELAAEEFAASVERANRPNLQ